MKTSEAMLKGFAMANGKQCYNALYRGPSRHPYQVCAIGARNLGAFGDASGTTTPERLNPFIDAGLKFQIEYGVHPIKLNDSHRFSVPVIAGMYKAIGE